VFCFNRKVNRELAEKLNSIFIEVVFAPGYDEDALEVLTQKENIRILEDNERRRPGVSEHDLKRVRGGLLIQDRDSDLESRDEMHVVTERKPERHEWEDLLFSWKVCKHVRSNAIVIAKDLQTVGIGAGQMSRVDSVRIALEKAQLPVEGSAMASDAFFPFPDGPQVGIDAGVKAIIQPGGSIRDHEVVEASDAAGVAMVFTSRRHFRH
jgi:phosphoribosylaminoimidazolecarboxamide formyltransferase/IMP cyclohydrolase